jgi:hypothetical protein
MAVHQEIERAQHLVGQYESGMAHYRQEIEKLRYRLGRLDERLGDAP